MLSYLDLLLLTVPVFATIAIGVLLRRLGWIGVEADDSLLKLVVNFFYPCLIFQSVLGNPALRNPANLILSAPIGFVTIVAGIFFALWCSRFLGLQVGAGKRTFAFTTGIYNYGYIPIFLMESLFGRDSLGVLLLFNVGCEAAIWTVGILVLSGASWREGWRKLLNAPVVALVLAISCNLLGLDAHVPKVVLKLVDMNAACAIPIGLLLIGATLAQYFVHPNTLFDTRISLGSSFLRMVLIPPAFLLLAKYLPIPIDLKQVIVVQAAMPAAIFPIVISKHYGGHPLVAVQVVGATTAIGLLLIPLWLRLGLSWIG